MGSFHVAFLMGGPFDKINYGNIGHLHRSWLLAALVSRCSTEMRAC